MKLSQLTPATYHAHKIIIKWLRDNDIRWTTERSDILHDKHMKFDSVILVPDRMLDYDQVKHLQDTITSQITPIWMTPIEQYRPPVGFSIGVDQYAHAIQAYFNSARRGIEINYKVNYDQE